MSAEIIPFPKENRRFPLHQFKHSFIYAQQNGDNISHLTSDAAAILAVMLTEILENLGFDTNRPELFCDFIMARETLKSYVMAYGDNKHLLQKIASNVISIQDNMAYFNQKNVYKMIRAVEGE